MQWQTEDWGGNHFQFGSINKPPFLRQFHWRSLFIFTKLIFYSGSFSPFDEFYRTLWGSWRCVTRARIKLVAYLQVYYAKLESFEHDQSRNWQKIFSFFTTWNLAELLNWNKRLVGFAPSRTKVSRAWIQQLNFWIRHPFSAKSWQCRIP